MVFLLPNTWNLWQLLWRMRNGLLFNYCFRLLIVDMEPQAWNRWWKAELNSLLHPFLLSAASSYCRVWTLKKVQDPLHSIFLQMYLLPGPTVRFPIQSGMNHLHSWMFNLSFGRPPKGNGAMMIGFKKDLQSITYVLLNSEWAIIFSSFAPW